MQQRACIIIPVYNDWTSFAQLVEHIAAILKDLDCAIEIIAIDDCSSELAPEQLEFTPPISSISVVRLVTNLGHQRAIAVGLVHLASRTDLDFVAIMDSDGEDRPEDLRELLIAANTYPGTVALAERTRRSEGLKFRFFYQLYIRVFKLLTTHNLKFGNFSVTPFRYLEQLITRPDTWNNYAASVIRARLPIRSIPTSRGTRYAGRSSMNFITLIIHGFGAMSVFSDVVLVRLLFASLLIFMATMVGVLIVIYVKLFTVLPIPGWASNVFGFLTLMAFNSVMLTVTTLFLQLNRRSTSQRHPLEFALTYIKSVTHLDSQRSHPPRDFADVDSSTSTSDNLAIPDT